MLFGIVEPDRYVFVRGVGWVRWVEAGPSPGLQQPRTTVIYTGANIDIPHRPFTCAHCLLARAKSLRFISNVFLKCNVHF